MGKNFLKLAGFAAIAGAAAAATYVFLKEKKQSEIIYECGECCFGDCDDEPILTDEDRAAAEQAFDEIEAKEKEELFSI